MFILGALALGAVALGTAFAVKKISDKKRRETSEEIGATNSYDSRTANLVTTERMSAILTDFLKGYLPEVTEKEEKFASYVEEYFDDLISAIEKVPGEKNQANLRALKTSKKNINKTITGGLKNTLSKRMSLDDVECRKILQMDSGDEKTKAMNRFSKKVMKEAVNNLNVVVREALEEQTENVIEYLSDMADSEKKEIKTIKEYLDKVLDDGNEEKGDVENNCIKPVLIVDAVTNVQDILV